MRAVRNLAEGVAGLTIVDEDLVIRAHAGEVVARRRVSYILNELRVRLDSL